MVISRLSVVDLSEGKSIVARGAFPSASMLELEWLEDSLLALERESLLLEDSLLALELEPLLFEDSLLALE
ncbi:hypothetical protein [Marinimicrobium locisalis]|uniref:hypothetical protein n=1 Tax=Marinimicrobium locisalis TaxID=546022 RepID=UPI003221E4B4